MTIGLVSVIIPNLHSPIVHQVVASVVGQEGYGADVEVLVVGLDRHGLIRQSRRTRFIQTEGPVPPAVARNIGLRHAAGEVICFLDADCIATEGWLAALLRRHTDPDVAVVGGAVTFDADNYWTLSDNISTFHEYLPTKSRGTRAMLPTLNLSVHRAVIEAAGPFDERFPRPAGEDADFALRVRRAGYALHFEPTAIVIHRPSRSSPSALWCHARDLGHYSARVNPAYANSLGVPAFLRHPATTLLLAPLIAAGATAHIFWRDPALWRHLHTAPAIWLAKVAWCVGAAQRLKSDQGQWLRRESKVR